MIQRPHPNHRLVAVLPTSLTLGNAVCGFTAISFAMEAQHSSSATHPLQVAGILILLAMLFDVLDGSVARLTRQTSAFGAHLDSLCDLVSFGVAPAVVLVQLPHMIPSRLLWCIALLFMLSAALRLARFNTDREEGHGSVWFSGLPTPAAAGVVASIVAVWPHVELLAANRTPIGLTPAAEWLIALTTAVVPWLALALACLMVSKVRYPHPVKQFLRGKRPLVHLVQVYFIVVAVFAVYELALPLIFLAFALGSPLRFLLTQVTTGIARLKTPEFT